ncbi:hypothetical protein MJO28_015715 [Puccinia striiformis f. sp. tritici]|uniref:Uncharacterized protein n=1 Tax=Puccinia striiformis f. sp. tritici TaxID=168172 RepID=A0ACC0DRG6_9BASI|nr:hypothetical protein MJO28_015715 [Puccinia striiformis f. sp. tritici]
MAIDYLVSLGPRNNSNNNIRFKLIQTIYDYRLLDEQNQALTTKKKEIEIGSAKYHKLKKTHPAPINTYLAGNEETIILVLNTNDSQDLISLQGVLKDLDHPTTPLGTEDDAKLKLLATSKINRQQQDPVESSVTDIRVLIQNMVDVGMDLPSEILAYLILFKLPSNFQSLKRQMQEG